MRKVLLTGMINCFLRFRNAVQQSSLTVNFFLVVDDNISKYFKYFLSCSAQSFVDKSPESLHRSHYYFIQTAAVRLQYR